MKALVYEAPRKLRIREWAEPRPDEGEVLVRIERVGICGSDLHAYLGHDERRPPPLILGHEAAGVVASGALQGQRVTINPLVTCGGCEACRAGRQNLCVARQILSMPPRHGAFAQFVSVPPENLFEIPADLDMSAAALAEPLAVSLHAVRVGLCHLDSVLQQNATALVVGGGAIGLGVALVLRERGMARVVLVEANPLRREALDREPGIDVFAPDDPAVPGVGEADMVIDAVGAEATRALASERVRPGGVIVHPGLQSGSGGLDIRRLTLQEISFVGCYTYTMSDFRQTVEWLASGRFGALGWLEEHPLEAGPDAFGDILAGRCAAAKIVLSPG